MDEDGVREPGVDAGPLANGFAPVAPLSFEESEKGLVFALVGTVASTRRTASMVAAFEAKALTDLVLIATNRAERRRSDRKDAELPMREVVAEVSAALRVSDRVAHRLLSDALTLTTAFPQTHSALGDGRISPSHVRVIVDAGLPISDDEARASYEAAVLRVAETESAGRLRSIARLLAARAHPESIDSRHRRARRSRDVRVIDADDGMAFLDAYMAATLAHGILDRLTEMAHTLRQREAADAKAAAVGDGMLPGLADLDEEAIARLAVHAAGEASAQCGKSADRGRSSDTATAKTGSTADETGAIVDAETEAPRSLDELRADLLADLLLSGTPTGHGDGLEAISGHVQITVPVLTAAGRSNEPAVLAGHGPVDVETARRLLGTAPGWDRVLTHPFSGEVLGVDRYRPTEQLRRFLRVRDQHCRFPNCRVPAWRTDIDHTIDAALGGETRDENLASLCRSHHVIKHKTEWQVRQLGGGSLEWTSPTGRIYVDVPERTLVFVADGDPPPF